MHGKPTAEAEPVDFSRVKLVAFDFDGVFTDNRVYVDQEGKEAVACWRSDGIGLSRLKEIGVKTIVISSEPNPVVDKRCSKLKIKCVSGIDDKLSALNKILDEKKLSLKDACFVGNDLPDLECLNRVGYPVAVKNSAKEVLKVVRYITKHEGGKGAVREVCDMICAAKKG